ncbi:MAG: hypothetical protein AAF290_03580 [Pseudomonadota bacterium]
MATTEQQIFEKADQQVRGYFTDIDGERFYAIANVDEMADFFISVVSHSDHWLFVSSNGALTAGRVSPDHALFPYVTVDKIHDSRGDAGCVTLIRVVDAQGREQVWEPFGAMRTPAIASRTLYKNTLGNQLCFEETHHELKLRFRYRWMFSERFGFVRRCELQNFGSSATHLEVLDGLVNILPAGTPRFAQTNTSNLVDAYKWTELDPASGLACYTLYSGITDRAEPCESLRANYCFSLGLKDVDVSLSAASVETFRQGGHIDKATMTRGTRGAYLARFDASLDRHETHEWQFVADLEKDQADIAALMSALSSGDDLQAAIDTDIATGSDALARLLGSSDAFQKTAEEQVSVHHYANVLFNVLRGGIVDHNYQIARDELRHALSVFDRRLANSQANWFDTLPAHINLGQLLTQAEQNGDRQLLRLCREYLPIRFGRRHGDPSRPWNQFAIELRKENGDPLLAYQGNWRDVFQNWEALVYSFPGFVESMIAKFVNASTVDGYNPYRITSEGIDWEVEEPDDPWSYIGYWGDHQIIYLQKLLELSQKFHPETLTSLLQKSIFCYANVPYRIRDFESIVADPKNTVDYDNALAERIESRVAARGADGKLVWNQQEDVYLVTLTEKLLVPLLAKLGNLVVDGGIWLNTQRPEWNDANNALVGHGLSMVTLYYLRRYITFIDTLFAELPESVSLSREVADWLMETRDSIAACARCIASGDVTPEQRAALMTDLGQAAANYRLRVYDEPAFSGQTMVDIREVSGLLSDTLVVIDHCIESNRRADGMYHAYNILQRQGSRASVDSLYPMLEGQVAALSSGAVTPREAVKVLEALFASPVYRADQQSFMLYPDRALPSFLERNRIPASAAAEIPLLAEMLNNGDHRLIQQDCDGHYRFNADLQNTGALNERIDLLGVDYGDPLTSARDRIMALYEAVFDHRSFTGRSGTMFGFEGLGCIYWHMVSKLLLAVQEVYNTAQSSGASAAYVKQLGTLYYRVRAGIGFNKTPAEYGAFPTDPYSHTPGHSGAQQPGMTGQVKEEIITRFGELGADVKAGRLSFRPSLLRTQEFCEHATEFRFTDVHGSWQTVALPAHSLAFTWCQVPVVYTLVDRVTQARTVVRCNGDVEIGDNAELSVEDSTAILRRSGAIQQLSLQISRQQLFD